MWIVSVGTGHVYMMRLFVRLGLIRSRHGLQVRNQHTFKTSASFLVLTSTQSGSYSPPL
jgi:hypothetical protein